MAKNQINCTADRRRVRGVIKKVGFERTVCDAILLQFGKPLMYDYAIPDPHKIAKYVSLAGDKLSGKQIPQPIDFNPLFYDARGFNTKFEQLPKRVREGIDLVFSREDREAANFIEDYLSDYKSVFGSEWFSMRGTFYRYRQGEKIHAEKRVNAFFKDGELAAFRKIGAIFRPYVSQLAR